MAVQVFGLTGKNVNIRFFTGGVGNPPGSGTYPHTRGGMKNILLDEYPEFKQPGRHNLLVLDCLNMQHVCPYRSYEHTGMNPDILNKVMDDPLWKVLLKAFIEGLVDAQKVNRTLVVLGSCTWGKHRCVGVVTLLRMLTVMLEIQPKPEPVTHMSSVRWTKKTCGRQFLCDACHAMRADKLP